MESWRSEKIRARAWTAAGCKRKDELVALAFAVTQQNLPVVASTDGQRDTDYQLLLNNIDVNGVGSRIEDPWANTEGWIDENKGGVALWPPCTYVNIAGFLTDSDQRAILTRLGNDYKEGDWYDIYKVQRLVLWLVLSRPVRLMNLG